MVVSSVLNRQELGLFAPSAECQQVRVQAITSSQDFIRKPPGKMVHPLRGDLRIGCGRLFEAFRHVNSIVDIDLVTGDRI
jgi:hypothetical protein